MSAAWDAFVASIDPVALERERAGVPDASERPGSTADRAMRWRCGMEAARFARLKARRAARELVAEIGAARRSIARREAAVVIELERLTPHERLRRLHEQRRAS